MSTTQGDIAKPEYPFGEGGNKRNDMLGYTEAIKKVNAERTKRYMDLVGKPTSDKKSRDGVIRRVKPQETAMIMNDFLKKTMEEEILEEAKKKESSKSSIGNPYVGWRSVFRPIEPDEDLEDSSESESSEESVDTGVTPGITTDGATPGDGGDGGSGAAAGGGGE